MKFTLTKDDLYRLYVIERKTSREIAECSGVSFRTVLRKLHENNISVRNRGNEHIQELHDADWLKSEYIGKSRSTIDIATQLNTHPSLVSHWLKRHKLIARPRNQHKGRLWSKQVRHNMSNAKKGRLLRESNPNWRGGEVNENVRLRASTQSKNWSKQVRQRDKHRCVKCGDNKKLHAHHIKPWNKYPELRYDLENGITLCVVCHQIEHGFKFKDWVVNDEPPRALDTEQVKI